MSKYQEAVQYLLNAPNFQGEVEEAWQLPHIHPAGCLFLYTSPNGKRNYRDENDGLYICGCLTQVKDGRHSAYTPELTELIRNDPTIPNGVEGITKQNIHRFAELQEIVDEKIRQPKCSNSPVS